MDNPTRNAKSARGRGRFASFATDAFEPLPDEVDVELPGQREAEAALKERRSREFLRGPIPLQKLQAAQLLPGAALYVYLLVHHQTRLTGQTMVRIPGHHLTGAGLDRKAKSRALLALEQAGLVIVQRAEGRTTWVRLA
jgi:hypothetical protein